MGSKASPEYIASLSRLDGSSKLRSAALLYWGARKLKAARLRQQHPEWSEQQINDKVREIFLHAAT